MAKAERDGYRSARSKAEENFNSVRENFDFTEIHPPCTFRKQCITPLTMFNSSVYPVTQCNLVSFSLKLLANVVIFGIFCEAVPRQANVLIDGSVSCGKGANPTISDVHYYFENHGLGEKDVHSQADNCGGQNKNNYSVWFFSLESDY